MSPYPLWPCIPFVFVSLLSPIISYPFLNEPFIPDTSLSFYVLLLSLCPLCPRVPFVPVPLLSPTYHLLSQYPVSIHRICNSITITITITVLIILNITVVFLFITISLSQLFCPFIPFLFPCPPRIPFACIIFVTVFLLSLHLFCLSIPCIPRPVSLLSPYPYSRHICCSYCGHTNKQQHLSHRNCLLLTGVVPSLLCLNLRALLLVFLRLSS